MRLSRRTHQTHHKNPHTKKEKNNNALTPFPKEERNTRSACKEKVRRKEREEKQTRRHTSLHFFCRFGGFLCCFFFLLGVFLFCCCRCHGLPPSLPPSLFLSSTHAFSFSLSGVLDYIKNSNNTDYYLSPACFSPSLYFFFVLRSLYSYYYYYFALFRTSRRFCRKWCSETKKKGEKKNNSRRKGKEKQKKENNGSQKRRRRRTANIAHSRRFTHANSELVLPLPLFPFFCFLFPSCPAVSSVQAFSALSYGTHFFFFVRFSLRLCARLQAGVEEFEGTRDWRTSADTPFLRPPLFSLLLFLLPSLFFSCWGFVVD